MKFKAFLLLGTSLMILSACSGESSEENADAETEETTDSAETSEGSSETGETKESAEVEDGGLIDKESTEPGWINFGGEHGGNPEYLTTNTIEYDPSKQYELSQGAYVAYYSGEEFIETSQMEHGGEIQTVENADNIRISYHKSFNNKINLSEQ
ncbi:hypothetical protein [Salinicoccus carnicancri]|uniref:hypothetical protein n=1 Tax=Salinicoccus carnicancri TaxID=558170 RepID=UPI000313C978|nr:hypothetical protein [Salinicoccus carnicancri]